jgi:uncharacterized protein (TIRG00374 family)
MTSTVKTLLVAALAIALLAFFLRNADLALVGREIARADPGWLLAAFVFTVVVYLLRASRWQYLLAPLGKARWRTAFRTTVIGFAAGMFIPRAGEVLRPYLLARQEGLSAASAFATIVVERLLDLLAVLGLFALFVVAFDPGLDRAAPGAYRAVKWGGLAATAAAVVVFVALTAMAGRPAALEHAVHRLERVLPGRLAARLARLLRTFAEGLAVVRQPDRLAASTALSVPLWMSIGAGAWATARAFQIDAPFTSSFLLLLLLTVGVAAPTPGAVGGFHEAFRFGLTTFYLAPNDRAVGAAIVLHAISFVPVTILGVIYMLQDGLNPGRMRRIVETASQERVP